MMTCSERIVRFLLLTGLIATVGSATGASGARQELAGKRHALHTRSAGASSSGCALIGLRDDREAPPPGHFVDAASPQVESASRDIDLTPISPSGERSLRSW